MNMSCSEAFLSFLTLMVPNSMFLHNFSSLAREIVWASGEVRMEEVIFCSRVGSWCRTSPGIRDRRQRMKVGSGASSWLP